MLGAMINRRLLPALAAACLAISFPAAAQSDDAAVSRAMIATLDLCLSVLKGQANWQAGLDAQGYRTTSTGGRVKPVGGSVVASSMGTNTVRGVTARLCEITAIPKVHNQSAFNSALAARAGALPPMGRGSIEGGGVMDGYANLEGSGLIVLAITDRPGDGRSGPSTSLSVIWK